MKIGDMNATIQGASHRYNIQIKDRSGKWLFEIFEKKSWDSEEINTLAVILSTDEIIMILPLIWKAISVDINLVESTIEDIVAKVLGKDTK